MKACDRIDVGAHLGRVSRRMFLGTTGAAGAAMLTGAVGTRAKPGSERLQQCDERSFILRPSAVVEANRR